MKKILSMFIAFTILLGFMLGGSTPVSAVGDEFAWVLVDTYRFPVPKYFSAGSFWIYSASFEGNTAEIRTTANDKNPPDFHAKYTWTNPPSIIKAKQNVTIRMDQEVISYNVGKYVLGYTPSFKADVADLELGYGTAGAKSSKGVYADGNTTVNLKLAPGYVSTNGALVGNGDTSFQKSTCVDLTLEFYDTSPVGTKKSIYIGCFAGPPGNIGTRYTYEWKKVDSNIVEVKPIPTTNQGAETFESGSRIMWQPASGLGYRLFRSSSQGSLGISVTNFYITSTSYADVNVEPETVYYYTVKPVIAEAKPFQGIEEKLGNAISTYTLKTGSQTYKPGSYKHFILLKLDNPNMSVDGINQEVDPGRGTSPLVIAGRTMVPIRAIVEAMGGTVEWEGSTQMITLKARGNTVIMWLGKTDITVNGVSKKMDIAPISKNDRTFVPVRFVAENLNSKVDWINSTKEAVIVYEE